LFHRQCSLRKRDSCSLVGSHFTLRLLVGMRYKGFAEPGAGFPRLDTRAQPLAVAWPVALDDIPKLIPIDLAEVVMAVLFIPCQIRVGDRKAQILSLGHGLVDELLAQLVVGKEFDLPLR